MDLTSNIDSVISKYLTNDKIYLSDFRNIECGLIFRSDDKHQWIRVEGIIDIKVIKKDMFIFEKNSGQYIYWCDVHYFLKKSCITIKEMREEKINKILYITNETY